MMLDVGDLPGEGWSEQGHKSWRTGKVGLINERRQRARRVGTYTGLRSYWNAVAQRTIATRLAPMASVIDAEQELPNWGLYLMVQPKIVGSVSNEVEIQDVVIPQMPNAVITERAVSGPTEATMMRMVRGNVERVIFVVGCGGQDEYWPWDEVLNVVGLQVAKIQRALETGQ